MQHFSTGVQKGFQQPVVLKLIWVVKLCIADRAAEDLAQIHFDPKSEPETCLKMRRWAGTVLNWGFTFFINPLILRNALKGPQTVCAQFPSSFPTSPTLQESWLGTKGGGMRRLPQVYLRLVEKFWIKLLCYSQSPEAKPSWMRNKQKHRVFCQRWRRTVAQLLLLSSKQGPLFRSYGRSHA